jgi:hypothetical protein
MNAVTPKPTRNDRAAEINRLRQELDDVIAIAEQFTDLVTCAGGRTINATSSGYRCFLCGADRGAGEPCKGARK